MANELVRNCCTRSGGETGQDSPALPRQRGSHETAVLLAAEAVTLNLGFMNPVKEKISTFFSLTSK